MVVGGSIKTQKNPGRNQRVGKWGENAAAQFLNAQGFTIIQRNYRTPFGELDLIAEKEDITHFIEVKTRTGVEFGLPEEAVTKAKRTHLLAAVQAYWMNSALPEGDWQIDVIAVLRRAVERNVEIEYFENAIH